MENKLKPWDGVCGYLKYKMPDQLLIDEGGTVNDIMWFDFEWVCEMLDLDYDPQTGEINR